MEEKDNLDINSNLGSFGDSKIEQKQQDAQPQPKEPNKDEKLNFEKFTTNKKSITASKLTIKMDMWLRNKKSLTIIWLCVLSIVIFVLISQICFPIFNTRALNKLSDGPKKLMKDLSQASCILSYISLSLIPPAFLFLFTTWITGVNGVHKSVAFHKFLWFCLFISILCALSSVVVGSIFQYDANMWHPPWN